MAADTGPLDRRGSPYSSLSGPTRRTRISGRPQLTADAFDRPTTSAEGSKGASPSVDGTMIRTTSMPDISNAEDDDVVFRRRSKSPGKRRKILSNKKLEFPPLEEPVGWLRAEPAEARDSLPAASEAAEADSSVSGSNTPGSGSSNTTPKRPRALKTGDIMKLTEVNGPQKRAQSATSASVIAKAKVLIEASVQKQPRTCTAASEKQLGLGLEASVGDAEASLTEQKEAEVEAAIERKPPPTSMFSVIGSMKSAVIGLARRTSTTHSNKSGSEAAKDDGLDTDKDKGPDKDPAEGDDGDGNGNRTPNGAKGSWRHHPAADSTHSPALALSPGLSHLVVSCPLKATFI